MKFPCALEGRLFVFAAMAKRAYLERREGDPRLLPGERESGGNHAPFPNSGEGRGIERRMIFYDLFFHSRREQEEETSPRALGRAALAEEEEQRG